jgi:hypothetical protein
MDITCWNCKKVTTLDKAAVETALAAMDAAKLGFHDVPCSSCGKSNRATRDVFEAGLTAFNAAPAMTQREINQAQKEEKAAKDKAKDEKQAAKEFVKKAKKKG